MSADENTRVSGDVVRPEASQTLPTVNPLAEKPPSSRASVHPVLYVV